MDDELSDDLKCALLIKRRQGFGGWAPYKLQCENKAESYVDGCDFVHGNNKIKLQYTIEKIH